MIRNNRGITALISSKQFENFKLKYEKKAIIRKEDLKDVNQGAETNEMKLFIVKKSNNLWKVGQFPKVRIEVKKTIRSRRGHWLWFFSFRHLFLSPAQ